MTTIERNSFREHRRREARLITTVLAVLGGIAFSAAVVPAVEHAITTGLMVGGMTIAVVLAIRLGLRMLRHRREDRADALAGARWRAEHAPHLLTTHERPAAGVVVGAGRGWS